MKTLPHRLFSPHLLPGYIEIPKHSSSMFFLVSLPQFITRLPCIDPKCDRTNDGNKLRFDVLWHSFIQQVRN